MGVQKSMWLILIQCYNCTAEVVSIKKNILGLFNIEPFKKLYLLQNRTKCKLQFLFCEIVMQGINRFTKIPLLYLNIFKQINENSDKNTDKLLPRKYEHIILFFPDISSGKFEFLTNFYIES